MTAQVVLFCQHADVRLTQVVVVRRSLFFWQKDEAVSAMDLSAEEDRWLMKISKAVNGSDLIIDTPVTTNC